MRALFSDRKRSERGAALIVFSMMMAMVVLPMVGLAIDGGIVYFAHSRLTAAVDAAALAGARSLNVGLDFTSQQTNAQNVAAQYFAANFPTGLLGSSNVTVQAVASQTGTYTRQVAVTASANVGLYFLQLIGKQTATIGAYAQSSRRDVNVVLTLDRSGSMQHVCSVLKSDAQNFVSMFTNGRDMLGLVTFMGSANVDFPSAKQFNPGVNNLLGTLRCGGNTGSAEAIHLAQQQIAGANMPGALPVIVFFTDGVPNGYSANFPLKSGTCNGSNTVLGYIADGGGIYEDFSAENLSQSITDTSTPYAPGNCAHGSLNQLGNSYSYIPSTDYWGNSGTGYQTVSKSGGNITFSTANSDAVSWNAADDAARQARNAGTFIYTIGLDGNGGVDGTLLERIANDPNAANYSSSQPTGKYYYSPNAGQLGAAFNAIAAEILRISQ